MQTQQALTEPRPVIVLIDDDQAVLNSLKFSLEIEGFAVQTFSDADMIPSAGELPSSGCLVIDYRLQGLNGLDLLAKLRSRDVALPAILITSYPNEPLRRRAERAGVPIVEKPLLSNALIENIRAALTHDDAAGKPTGRKR